MFIDTHAHLNFEAFKDDWEEVVDLAVKEKVRKMIVVGTDLPLSERAIKLAEQSSYLFSSIGIHPHHAREWLEITNYKLQITNAIEKLKKLAKHPKVVAIGEVGLDYHIYRNSKRYQIENSEKEWTKLKNLQKRLLGMQVEVAKELDKPLIIHSREVGDDVLDVIEHFSKSDGKMPTGVFHCFDGSKKHLKKVIEAGFYVGFTGNITYVDDRAKVASGVPLERLLLETDCPYMSAYRKNKRSTPGDVKIIAEFHAKKRGISVKVIEEKTTENAKKLFKI